MSDHSLDLLTLKIEAGARRGLEEHFHLSTIFQPLAPKIMKLYLFRIGGFPASLLLHSFSCLHKLVLGQVTYSDLFTGGKNNNFTVIFAVSESMRPFFQLPLI
jgi:hypothetical protein